LLEFPIPQKENRPAADERFTAIVLAGARSRVDPFVESAGVATKALIPIDGVAMIERVVDTLKNSPRIGAIIIVTQDEATLEAACPGLFSDGYGPGVQAAPAAQSVCTSIISAVSGPGAHWPFLVTTSDHPLLTLGMIEEFCEKARESKAGMAIGVVERWLFRRRYPDNRRTFIPLNDTQISGCNLFILAGPDATKPLELWRRVENERKKPWRIFSIFGFGELVSLLLRRYTLDEAFERASKRLGVNIVPISLSDAEAAIDVDKEEDLRLATQILATRKAAGETALQLGKADGRKGGRVVVFDLDRTITRRGTFTPYLLSFQKGLLARLGLMARLLSSMALYKAGRLTRRQLKDRMLAQALKGASAADIRRSAHEFVTRLKRSGLREEALRVIERHKAAGDRLVLATASMDFYAEILGRDLGFDAVVATRTSWEDGASPRLGSENCYGAEKLAMLQEALNLHPEMQGDRQIVFYSDHHTDLPVFAWAQEKVAVNPSRRLKAMAESQGIEIVYW